MSFRILTAEIAHETNGFSMKQVPIPTLKRPGNLRAIPNTVANLAYAFSLSMDLQLDYFLDLPGLQASNGI